MTGTTWRQRWRDDIRDSDDPALDVYAKAVAMALDRFMSANGVTCTGRRRLARLAGITSNATVHDRIDRLIRLGWLARDWAGRGSRPTYRVAYPTGHSRHAEWTTWARKVAYPVTESGLPGRPDPAMDPGDTTPGGRARRTGRRSTRDNGSRPNPQDWTGGRSIEDIADESVARVSELMGLDL